MRKKTIGIMVVILAGIFLYVIINVAGNQKSTVKSNGNSKNNVNAKAKDTVDRSIQMIDTAQLQTQKDTWKDLKDRFSNLNLEDAQFILPEVQSVYRLSIRGVYPYQNEKDVQGLIDKELDFIRHFRTEELNPDDLFDCGNAISFKEVQEAVRQGTFFEKYKEYPSLVYSQDDERKADEPYCYIHVFADFGTIWFEQGKIDSLLEQKYSGEPDQVCRLLEEYNRNAFGNQEYTLADGTITIAQAVAFVEDYLRDQLPYETNPEVVMKVQNVKVLEVTEDISALQLQVTRSYGGIPFEAGGLNGSTTDIDTYRKDIAMAYMVEKEDIDLYCGTDNGNTDSVEKEGEEICQVVSVESALKIISDKIGDNSDYDISQMEIVYRRKIVNLSMAEGTEYIGIPYWKITAKNRTDGKETYFYVELQNGELSYATRK